MNVLEIGIIGLGVVGSAIRLGMLKLGHTVKVHDLKLRTSITEVFGTELVFICVPTYTVNGKNDITQVESTIHLLDLADYKGVIVIKSTVIPGTTDYLSSKYPKLAIAFSPEFLRERCAETDFIENLDLLPIGTDNEDVFKLIKTVHGNLPKHTIQMSPREAEYLKYFCNTFNALRIVFANSFSEICNLDGVDYRAIKAAAVLRKNIPDADLDVNDILRGFGGTCLPKDTEAFASHAERIAPHYKLFKTILEENKKFPTTVFNGMRNQ